MPPDHGLFVVPLIAYVSIVAVVDAGTHRIPNALSATAALLALSGQIWIHGWAAGALIALGGAAVALTMFLPFYFLRAFGAGDVKAMAVVGLFLGAKLTLLAAAMTLVAGALVGIVVLWASSPGAHAALYRLASLAAAPVWNLRDRRKARSSPPQRFPYGTAIAVGTVATLLAMGRLQFSL